MNGVVRLNAINSLVDVIHDSVEELAVRVDPGAGRTYDPVKVVQMPPDQSMKFPCLAIVPATFRFEPNQESIHSEPDDDTAVINVGRWIATLQFRLACATLAERYKLEEKLVSLFWQRENASGILVTSVAEDTLGDFIASWELDSSEWQDELAFSSQSWAVMTFTGVIPALVKRAGVYTIKTLKIGLTHDFAAAFTAATFTTSKNLRVVQVAEDGTITPA